MFVHLKVLKITLTLVVSQFEALTHLDIMMTPKEIDEAAKQSNMSTQALLDLGKQYLDNQIQYGATTWYEWSIANWGTKWNVEEGSLLNEDNILTFDTAWSAPAPIIRKLSENFPSIEFLHEWSDEDLGNNVGRVTYKSGLPVEIDLPEPYSAQAYELAFEIQGIEAADACLRFDVKEGTYVYDESLAKEYTFEPESLDNLIDFAAAQASLQSKDENSPEHEQPNRDLN